VSKKAISVTLAADNLVWLRGRAEAGGFRSVSELLDHLVSGARHAGAAGPARSVAGTVDIADDDADLEEADRAVRSLFEKSLRRPVVVKERSPQFGHRQSRKSARGRS